jgi:hypothetical protein
MPETVKYHAQLLPTARRRLRARRSLNRFEVLSLIGEQIVAAGSLRQHAKNIGADPSYLSRVMKGVANPGPSILATLNLAAASRTTLVYSRVDHP